jgi:hypothetical protein
LKIPKQRANDFTTIYANNVALTTAPYDVSLIFGEIQFGLGEKPLLIEKCRVVMSPGHGKALARVLTANIEKWEKQHGAIQLPRGASGNEPAAGGNGKPSTKGVRDGEPDA